VDRNRLLDKRRWAEGTVARVWSWSHVRRWLIEGFVGPVAGRRWIVLGSGFTATEKEDNN